MPDMFQIGEDDVALAKGGTIGRSRRHYRRDRDLPRLVGESVTPLPPPGPDYTIRLLSLLSGLATRTPAHPSGRLCPSAAAAYAALAIHILRKGTINLKVDEATGAALGS